MAASSTNGVGKIGYPQGLKLDPIFYSAQLIQNG
jgi:hypothetical protein